MVKSQRLLSLIRDLDRWNEPDREVLSVYLGISGQRTPYSEELLTKFHSLLRSGLPDSSKKLFRRDILRIESYLKEIFDRRGIRTLAFFSAGRKLWQVADFEFYLPSVVKVAPRPLLRPIKSALVLYEPYLVVLADREKAKYFTVNLGKIQESGAVFDDFVPQYVRAGGEVAGRDGKIYRHINDHLHRHFSLIGTEVKKFVKNYRPSFLVIGGHSEHWELIRRHLPYPLGRMVRGVFSADLDEPIGQLLRKSKRIAAS